MKTDLKILMQAEVSRDVLTQISFETALFLVILGWLFYGFWDGNF